VLATVQWLHIGFALWWMGYVMYNQIAVQPALRRLPPDLLTAYREGASRLPPGRGWENGVVSFGTVALGAARGLLSGALSDLTSLYGLTYLAALFIGLLMAIQLTTHIWQAPIAGRLWLAGFPLMLGLMVALRFGY
jgi:hypothetical protein